MTSLKKISLGLVVATALSFSGCGSSSSSDNTPVDAADDIQNSTVSGKAIDGYLEKALVCLDRNKNNDCDADEPMSITNSQGDYTLIGITDEDKEKYAILVKAILGQTRDSDDNGETIKKAFFLKASASNANIVSPITTIIQNKIERDPTLSVVEAIAETKNILQISEDIDILGDYIANKVNDTNNTAIYEKLHKVAEVIADSIGDSLNNSNMDFGDSDFADAGISILNNLDDKLGLIMQKTSDENISIESIISDLNTTKNVTSDEITIIKEEKVLIEKISNANQKVNDSKDFENALKNGGLHTFAFWANNQDEASLHIYDTSITGNNIISSKIQEYYFSNNIFVNGSQYNQSVDNSTQTLYKLSDNGWVKTNDKDSNQSVLFDNNGVMSVKGMTTTALSNIKLSNLNIDLMLHQPSWKNDIDSEYSAKSIVDDNVLFSKDALKIKTKTIIKAYENITVVGEFCGSTGSCNDYGKFFDGETFQTIEEFKLFYAKGGENYYHVDSGSHAISYMAQFDNNVMYLHTTKQVLNQYNNYELVVESELPLLGKLQERIIKNKSIYEFIIPEEYRTKQNITVPNANYGSSKSIEFITFIDSFIRKGQLESSDMWFVETRYNAIAIKDIKDALENGLKIKFNQ